MSFPEVLAQSAPATQYRSRRYSGIAAPCCDRARMALAMDWLVAVITTSAAAAARLEFVVALPPEPSTTPRFATTVRILRAVCVRAFMATGTVTH